MRKASINAFHNKFRSCKHFSRSKTISNQTQLHPAEHHAATARILRTKPSARSTRSTALRKTTKQQSQMQPVRMALHHPTGQQRHLQNQNQYRRNTIHAGLRRPKRTRKPPHRNQTLLSLLARLNRTHIFHMVLQLQLPMVPKPPPLKNRTLPPQKPLLRARKNRQLSLTST